MNLPKNFDQLNERRHALIDRKYSSNQGLSPAEEKELAELQEIAGQVRDALTPPLRPDIQATIDALKDPAKLEAISPETVSPACVAQSYWLEGARSARGREDDEE